MPKFWMTSWPLRSANKLPQLLGIAPDNLAWLLMFWCAPRGWPWGLRPT
jgi:hypothetical protein